MSTVLLIEDELWLAELLCTTLEQAEYRVVHAADPYEAIDYIDDSRPDIIVLDVLLKGATAFGLLHELRSYGDTAQIPVILCTNNADTLKVDSLAAYGVVKVIDKTTMNPGDLVAGVRSIL